MNAKQFLEKEYADACARLGDVVYKLEQLQEEKRQIEQQLKELNRALPRLQSFEKSISEPKEQQIKALEMLIKDYHEAQKEEAASRDVGADT